MNEKEENRLHTDPVCRMEVKEEEAITTECDGVIYYFCSEGCRDKFLFSCKPLLKPGRP